MEDIYKEAIQLLLEDLYVRTTIEALNTGLKFKHDRADKIRTLKNKVEEKNKK